jgi:adhesin HecA-like repeat protein
MGQRLNLILRGLLGATAYLLFGAVFAVEQVANGSFEANGGVGTSIFANWTSVTHPSSANTRFFVQSGNRAPIAAFAVSPAALGSFAAMSDQPSPGATAIYQNVSVPASGRTWVQMRLFVLNQAPEFLPLPSLDPNLEGNQQVRVDVLNTSAGDFDVGAGVLLNVFRTRADFPRESGYFPIAIDLAPFAGQTVRIRVAEVDNRQGLLVGVDDVRVTNVPPATCAPVRPRDATASCNLDVDGDGLLTSRDGLLVLRRLLGFAGGRVTDGVAFDSCATRNNEALVNAAIDPLFSNGTLLDFDGDSRSTANTDGLVLLRSLGGRTGNPAIAHAVGDGAARTTWDSIRLHMNETCLAALLP